MSGPSNKEHHYRNLRDRYTNCTYVDGNLELTWLQDEHLDLSFLQHIREVTSYVLISHVDVRRIVLPALQYCLITAVLPFLPESRLVRLVFFFEPVGPTAAMVVVLAQIHKQQRAAATAVQTAIPGTVPSTT